MIDTITRLLAPLRNRVANMIARAVVQLVNDGAKLQALQIVVGSEETREGVERFQEYGFSSVPLAGAEAVVVFVGGRRDHGLVIAVDDRRYRLKDLEPGEVALYTDEGDYIHFKRGGIVKIKAGTKVTWDTPAIEWGQPATDAAVKGTTYRTAEDTLLTAIATAIAAVAAVADAKPPVTTAAGTACTVALANAISAFNGAAASYLSAKVKVG